MSAHALIAEPRAAVATALRQSLQAAGLQGTVVQSLEEALEAVRTAPWQLVLAGVSPAFAGEVLCQRLKALLPQLPVVLVFAPEEEAADARARSVGADHFLLAPLKQDATVAAVRLVLELAAWRQGPLRLAGEGTLPSVPEQPGPLGEFAFFQRFLLMEVKRCRRYRFPVSFLLLGLDGMERPSPLPPQARARGLAEVLQVLVGGMRDIDLAVPFSEGRILAFLPHTAREGALLVAERLRARVAAAQGLVAPSVSVGVACFEPGAARGAQVSFESLLQEATEALLRAWRAGGNRVEASLPRPRSRISMG